MPDVSGTSTSFDELWRSVSERPVLEIEGGEGEDPPAADALAGWLREIADACLSRGLVTEAQHGELRQAADTCARLLGGIAPDDFRATLRAVGDPGD
jgi:hypothetical protein